MLFAAVQASQGIQSKQCRMQALEGSPMSTQPKVLTPAQQLCKAVQVHSACTCKMPSSHGEGAHAGLCLLQLAREGQCCSVLLIIAPTKPEKCLLQCVISSLCDRGQPQVRVPQHAHTGRCLLVCAHCLGLT